MKTPELRLSKALRTGARTPLRRSRTPQSLVWRVRCVYAFVERGVAASAGTTTGKRGVQSLRGPEFLTAVSRHGLRLIARTVTGVTRTVTGANEPKRLKKNFRLQQGKKSNSLKAFCNGVRERNNVRRQAITDYRRAPSGRVVIECGICCEVFESGSKDLIEACAEANRACREKRLQTSTLA